MLVRILIALAVGGAGLFLLPLPAAVVVGWYSFEFLKYLSALRSRCCLLVYLGPRVVSILIALAVAWLLLPPARALPLAYLLMIALEGVYRLALHLWAGELLREARAAWNGNGEAEEAPHSTPRTIAGMLIAGLFVILTLVTSFGYAAREVLLAPGFYRSLVEDERVYNALVGLVGEAAVDIARGQGAEERRAVAFLSEQDVNRAARLLMPKRWTAATLDRVLVATIAWLRADGEQRVPSLSLPVRDVWRHARDATSFMLDLHMARLPTCTPDMPGDTYCRPEDMSVDAYIATYKPGNLARVDDMFSSIPAEVELATAVTLAPRQMGKLVDTLGEARRWVGVVGRVLKWAAVACLLSLAALSLVGACSPRAAARWVGATLTVAGALTWAMGWTLVSLTLAIVPYGVRLFEGMPAALTSAVPVAFARAVRELISLPALTAIGGGLVLIAISWLLTSAATRAGERVARVVVIALAIGTVAWGFYLDAGNREYAQARRYAARQSPEVACREYHHLAAVYPLRVGNFVTLARYHSRECRLYREAETAYQNGDYEVATRSYEALLVGDVPLTMRQVAEKHLIDSLYKWAMALQKAGERERALDRYRFIRDEFGDPRVEDEIAALYYGWGAELEARGDYKAAIATYRRVTADVMDYRLWREADERTVAAYCAWAVALSSAGQWEQVAQVCADLRDAFPKANLSSCDGCASR